MPRLPRRVAARLALMLPAVALLLLAACGGDEEPPPAPPTAPPPLATATPAAPAVRSDVSGTDAVLRHIRVLTVEIGVRSSTSDGERRAAEYLAGEFRGAGYTVEIQRFPVEVEVESTSVESETFGAQAFMMRGSPQGEASGRLVFAGLGDAAAITAVDVTGAIVLLDRGIVTFSAKVANAERAGAAGVVVVNNEPGPFRASLGQLVTRIPSVSVALEQREALVAIAEAGGTLTIVAREGVMRGESQNVVARASDAPCRLYIGAHYDSVQRGPGANDNASGTAFIVELARAHRTDGLCAVAFGSEEIGLLGSLAFLERNDVSAALAMLNFDMQGLITEPVIIGDADLVATLAEILREAGGFPIRPGDFPPFTSSDHVAFADAGVPAVTITSGDDAAIHSPRDDFDHIDAQAIAIMFAIADALLQGLLSPEASGADIERALVPAA